MIAKVTKRARELRHNPTEAEKYLWYRLKSNQLGVKFQRQYPIGPFIVDFMCKDKRLVIEVDGGQHASYVDQDLARSRFIEEKGFRIIRFWNNEVLGNLDGVLDKIMTELKDTPPSIPPQTGGGKVGSKITLRGGKALKGSIAISGAKNAALKLACAAILTDQPVTFTRMPNSLRDMRSLYDLLVHLGGELNEDGDRTTLTFATVASTTAPYDLVRKMRASIMVLGPLLAREGKAKVSLPGGCAIGTRPVDYHIEGLKALGAQIELKEGYIHASTPNGRLEGGLYRFPKVSHTGTENLMMAATLAEGETILENAAQEPEVVDLADCLRGMGAQISGDGTATIRIQGVEKLEAAEHDVMPDRIEAGTFMIAAGMTGGDLFLEGARADHLQSLIALLEQSGISIEVVESGIRAFKNDDTPLQAVKAETAPYPGFATDLQAQLIALLCVAEGAGQMRETIFENRFMHVPELARMGADISVIGNTAVVNGVEKLIGAEVMATDLRASVALVLAGLVAEGETTINRIYHLERGYEDLVGKLSAVGADIRYV